MFPRIKKIIREYKELKFLAYHDSLTGLLNRNWLYKNIDDIEHDFVYFIDINDLRFINQLGHTFGDAHIKMIVSHINVHLTTDDVFIRYAGDEFIIFSNDKDLVYTNKLYAVGVADCGNVRDIIYAVNSADELMIKNKRLFKSK